MMKIMVGRMSVVTMIIVMVIIIVMIMMYSLLEL